MAKKLTEMAAENNEKSIENNPEVVDAKKRVGAAPVAKVNVQELAPISAIGEVVAKRKAQLRELDRKRG